MSKFKLPNSKQRIAVIGMNGTGKTQSACWILSQMNFDKIPWVIIDYKTDELINAIDRAQHIDFDFIPKKAGIYILHPLPELDDERLEDYLWKLWSKEDVGIYIDEGYMIPSDNKAFKACLTQGRSRHIPMIVLTQRPSWISRFVFSEANFIQVFHLNDKRDKKTVEAFTSQNVSVRLPDYHSYYHDVGNDQTFKLSPVPDASTILETFNAKLQPKRKWL